MQRLEKSRRAGKQHDDQILVVLNDEEQYSIWPAGGAMPVGWRSEVATGIEAECYAELNRVAFYLPPLLGRIESGLGAWKRIKI